LGGIRSTSTTLIDNTGANLFPDAQGTETLAGSNSYLCLFVRNENGTVTFQNVRFYVSQLTDSLEDEITIAIGSVAKNTTEITVANINTAPAGGITFTGPTTYATGLVIPDLAPNDYFPIWFKRAINASLVTPLAANSFKFDVDGDTGP
jgi:hypothetical protein